MNSRTLIVIYIALLCRIPAFAQGKSHTDPVPDSAYLTDSLLVDLKSLLDSFEFKKSFVGLNITLSNALFSLRNDNFNAQQALTSKLSLTPSLSYYHRSGLGMTGAAFLIFDSVHTGIYQYVLSPSYDYVNGKQLAFGISFTHYFKNADMSDYSSPFNNEWYAYIHGKKQWMRPGLSLGYARGQYKDVYIKDTTILGLHRIFFDTTRTTLSDFSIAASVSHDFEWNGVFSKNDNITVTPVLYLTGGTQFYEVHSQYKFIWLAEAGRLARKFRTTADHNTNFQLQSLACLLSVDYYIGGFSISPQYYVSYFLPSASSGRWSNIGGISIGWIF